MTFDIVHGGGRSCNHNRRKCTPSASEDDFGSDVYILIKTQFRQAQSSATRLAQSTACLTRNPVFVGSKPLTLMYFLTMCCDF
jgi:hypothetical protein